MKNQLSILSLVFLAACQNAQTTETNATETAKVQQLVSNQSSSFIPVDSANKMVTSYLASINHPQKDSAVLSFTFSASELRRLLDSVDHPDSLKDVQIRLAHSLDYINNGPHGTPAGFNKNALRLLISGVDYNGNTILLNNEVMNHSMPCPNSCPPGTAALPLFN
jgi:hypothetical protein